MPRGRRFSENMNAIEEHWLLPFLNCGLPCGSNVAFDIGANVGEWSLLMASRCRHVVAVEPDARAYSVVASQLRDADACLHAAASSHCGEGMLYVRPQALQSSLLPVHPIGAGGQADAPIVKSVPVPLISLDEIAARFLSRWAATTVDFVKIDVEGAEAAVLAGATLPCFERTKWLIEVHDTEASVVSEIRRLGFVSVTVIRHPIPGAHPRHFWIYADKEVRQ